MHARVFVDTNIWLYALIQSHADDSRHQQARDFLLGLERPVINSQVIREISSNLIKKARLPEAQLRELLEGWYRDCEVITSNAAQHLLASQLRGSHSLSYWDSLIIAAAIDAGCTTLYSEDMQHGQNMAGCVSITNPFLAH